MEKLKELKPENFYIAGVGIALLAILICFLRIGEIYEVISEFGADNRTALLFNILLLASGISVTLGSALISMKYFKVYGKLQIIVLLICSASLIFLALFPLGISQQIRVVHWTFAAIFFFGFAIAQIIFSFLFRKSNQNIFLLLLVTGIVDLLQLLVLYPNNTKLLAQIISIVLSILFLFVLVQFSSKISENSEDNNDFNQTIG